MRKIQLPIEESELLSLNAFDQVLLTGTLYVGRDQVHSRLFSLLEKHEPLPITLQGQAIYYMGPSPAPEGFPLGACGPTTSARMDPFAPRLLDEGLRVMVGKGPRSSEVVASIIRNRALYLQAYGGCGALYASTIRRVKTLAFAELGPEALLELEVEDFPVIVAIDSKGKSVFTR
ncbi:MAG TPA: FumA C-terminus/TtdB family hydratase beta subunit [Sphaerochaeta sp.]|nr:FumA C-terminus/TtdB family hydratase beta subunit [Sphaerochaeta sp.]